MVRTTDVEAPAAPNAPHGILPSLHIDWETVAHFLVPIGYQDAAGFHYGTPGETLAEVCSMS